MEQKTLFKVRDRRNKGWFFVDNEYLNGFGKFLGGNGVAIYIDLCRHSDIDQKCFPSQKTIAEELNLSVNTVKKYLKLFVKFRLIEITKERNMQGKWINNTYWLLDKSEWIKPGATIGYGKPEANNDQAIANQQQNHRQPLPTNNTHKKNTNKNMSDKPTWNLQDKIKQLLGDNRRHLVIIGIWIREMQLKPQNQEQLQSIIRRNLRPAKDLIGYQGGDIIDTIQTLKKTEYLKKITLETITKYIDEIVAAKVKKGPKIIRWEEVKDSQGNIRMKPIYQKT